MILIALAALAFAQDGPSSATADTLPVSIQGHWSGALVRQGALLPFELQLDGNAALINVPTWGFYAWPGTATYEEPRFKVSFAGTHLQFEVEPVAGAMTGFLQTGVDPSDVSAITAQLTRVLAPALVAIAVEEVRFTSADGVELAGTLALPSGPGPHPAIVIVQGRSYGPRDQFRGHAVLAARRGIAALAFDGRGTGASGGGRGTHTRDNRLDDAQAALELVRDDPRVDPERVGMFGHSSGGWVIPIVAERAPPVAFLVMHSGPAEPLGDQQGRVFGELAKRAGIDPTEEELATIHALIRDLTAHAAAGTPWEEVEPLVVAARESRWAEHVPLPEGPDDVNYAYYGRNPHDATEALRATKLPVLALFGRDDFVVNPEINAGLLESHLNAAGNEDQRTVIFEGADHDLMIPEVEGDEYRWQRRPPGYFETLFTWIEERVFGE